MTEQQFIKHLKNIGLTYIKINNDDLLEKIYDLYVNGNMIDINNFYLEDKSILLLYVGAYYETIEKNYELMKKYYLMAIELNYYNAMYNLGYYYKYIEKNYELMEKYFSMVIEIDNNIYAALYLSQYYEQNKMIKKLLMLNIKIKNTDK